MNKDKTIQPTPIPETSDLSQQPIAADTHTQQSDSAGAPAPESLPDPDEIQRRIEQAEKEAYARGRAEAVEEYLNPNPFFTGLHGSERAVPTDPDLQRILRTRESVW